jgi:hypothetical protein
MMARLGVEVRSLVGVEVQRVDAAGWKELREVRLRALADAPDAFASTLEREAAFPEEVWRQRAQGHSDRATCSQAVVSSVVVRRSLVQSSRMRTAEGWLPRAVRSFSASSSE